VPLHSADPVQRARFSDVEVRLGGLLDVGALYGATVSPCFCPTHPPISLHFLCLSHFTRCAADLAHSDEPILLTRRPTTRDRRPANCHATAKLNAIHRQILHRLHQHITCSPNTASCSCEQTPTTNRSDLPCSYQHRHITAPSANRPAPIDCTNARTPMYA
jgi:hypothetical protein